MHKIFGYFIKRSEDSKEDLKRRAAYATWFRESFPATEFRGEELLFYEVLAYAEKFATAITEKSLKVFLSSEMRSYVLKNKVKVKGTEDLNNFDDMGQLDSLIAVTKDTMLGHFFSLQNETCDIDEFMAEADMFMREKLDERSMQIMQTAYEMRTTVVNGLTGSHDSTGYLLEETAYVKSVYDESKLEELASVAPNGNKKRRFLFKTGIPAVDTDTMGMYTRFLVGVEADAGMGKTKFATGVFTYQAAVEYGKSVIYYALEQDNDEIESNLIARHCYTLFNEVIDAKLILFDQVPAELKKKVEAARIDLFESGKYGKIVIKGRANLYLETFLDKIRMDDRLLGPFDVVIIDYMALIEQAPTRGNKYQKVLQEYEIIKYAYRKFKRFVLNEDKLGIAVNQLNATGGDKAKKGQDIGTGDAQGGKEVYRSTDYNITIVATPEMEAKGMRELVSPKKRNSAGLGRVLLKTMLAACLWRQSEKTNL